MTAQQKGLFDYEPSNDQQPNREENVSADVSADEAAETIPPNSISVEPDIPDVELTSDDGESNTPESIRDGNQTVDRDECNDHSKTQVDEFLVEGSFTNEPQADGSLKFQGKMALSKEKNGSKGSERQARYKDNKEESGQKRLHIWVYLELEEKVRNFIARENAEHEKRHGISKV